VWAFLFITGVCLTFEKVMAILCLKTTCTVIASPFSVWLESSRGGLVAKAHLNLKRWLDKHLQSQYF